jgi:hypothetical protein
MNARLPLWLPLLAGLATALPATPAQAQFRTVADDGWCDRDRDGDWSDRDNQHYCEVREAVLPASARIGVDAGPNGGIKVEGWDRSEIRVRAKVTAGARATWRPPAPWPPRSDRDRGPRFTPRARRPRSGPIGR